MFPTIPPSILHSSVKTTRALSRSCVFLACVILLDYNDPPHTPDRFSLPQNQREPSLVGICSPFSTIALLWHLSIVESDAYLIGHLIQFVVAMPILYGYCSLL